MREEETRQQFFSLKLVICEKNNIKASFFFIRIKASIN